MQTCLSRPKITIVSATAIVVCTNAAYAQNGGQDDGIDVLSVLLLSVAVIYLIPTIVAFIRGHPNRWPILVINIVFGGTGLGWLGCMVWACSAVHRSPTGNHGGESGLNLFANDPILLHIDGAGRFVSSDRDPSDELLRLKQLFDAGAIDEAEYRRLRAGPLSRLVGQT